jgi:salicylate hydroxylase
MEDGVWLARVLREVLEGRFTLAEALELYEKTRMPKVAEKQQVSFINGVLWQLPDGPEQEVRHIFSCLAPYVH